MIDIYIYPSTYPCTYQGDRCDIQGCGVYFHCWSRAKGAGKLLFPAVLGGTKKRLTYDWYRLLKNVWLLFWGHVGVHQWVIVKSWGINRCEDCIYTSGSLWSLGELTDVRTVYTSGSLWSLRELTYVRTVYTSGSLWSLRELTDVRTVYTSGSLWSLGELTDVRTVYIPVGHCEVLGINRYEDYMSITFICWANTLFCN